MPIRTHDSRALPGVTTSRVDQLSSRAAELAARHSALQRTAAELVQDCPGELAQELAALADEWSSGADQVLEALAAQIASLHHANERISADGRAPAGNPAPEGGRG